jgi:ABC-type glycerol-3-phosphate transport system permease component
MRLRKAPALAMASALVLSAVAACSDTGDSAAVADPADASGTVTMWIHPINEAIEDTYWEPMVSVTMAAAVCTFLPILLVYLLLQRDFVRGVVTSGLN